MCPSGVSSQHCVAIGYFEVDAAASGPSVLSLSWRSPSDPKGDFAPSSLVFRFEAQTPNALTGVNMVYSNPGPGVETGSVTLFSNQADKPVTVKAGHSYFCDCLTFTGEAHYDGKTATVAVSFSNLQIESGIPASQHGSFGSRDTCPSGGDKPGASKGLSTGALAGISIGESICSACWGVEEPMGKAGF